MEVIIWPTNLYTCVCACVCIQAYMAYMHDHMPIKANQFAQSQQAQPVYL